MKYELFQWIMHVIRGLVWSNNFIIACTSTSFCFYDEWILFESGIVAWYQSSRLIFFWLSTMPLGDLPSTREAIRIIFVCRNQEYIKSYHHSQNRQKKKNMCLYCCVMYMPVGRLAFCIMFSVFNTNLTAFAIQFHFRGLLLKRSWSEISQSLTEIAIAGHLISVLQPILK